MAAGFAPSEDELLARMRESSGLVPADPVAAAAHEQEVLTSTPGVAPVPLAGGGFLGDLPAGAGTSALTFTPPAAPVPIVPPPAPVLAPPPSAVPSAPVSPPGAASAPRQSGGGGAGGGLNTAAEEAKALAAQGPLTEKAVDAERAASEVRQKNAAADSQGAEVNANIAGDHEEAQKKALEQANARTQQWADRASAETEKYLKMQPVDYWADKSTANKVLAGAAMLFGAMGRTSNADNPGMNMINQAIERDFRLQTAKIEKAKSNATAAQGQYELGLTAKQQALADLQLKKSAAFETAAAQVQALKMKNGMSLEQAQTDGAVVALRQKANDTRFETLKAIHGQNVQDAQLGIQRAQLGLERQRLGIERQKVENKQRPVTEFSGKEQALSARMIQDYRTLRAQAPLSEDARKKIRDFEIKSDVLDKNGALKAGANLVGLYNTIESQLSPADRTAFQAGRRLAAAQLRGESGAAIAPSEYLNWSRDYLPYPGDSPENIKVKNRGIQTLIDGHIGNAHDPQSLMAQIQPPEGPGGGGAPGARIPQGKPPPEVVKDATAVLRDPKSSPQDRELAKSILLKLGG